MPELPEVETVRRGLDPMTCNIPIQDGSVLLPRTVAFPPDPDSFITGLQDCQIKAWHRRGKYLLAEQEKSNQPAGWWGVHLRMTGQLLWVHPDSELQKHTRVRIFFEDNQELRFVDTRTFGQMWWVPPGTAVPEVVTGLQKLGPEPFSEEFSLKYFSDRLKKSRRPIKNALLDQRLVAGIGNIYADESLFLSGIRPTRPTHHIGKAKLEKLHGAIVQVLQDSIGAGGTTFSDFRDIKGGKGQYGGQAWVYNRTGEDCRTCGTTIERIKLGGRSSHFCPTCQK